PDGDGLHVFALRQGDLMLLDRGFDGKWSPWNISGTVTGRAPATCSWGSNRFDVIISRPAAALFSPVHRWWDGAWHEETLDDQLGSDPAVATWGAGRLDVFQQKAGHLMHKVWEAASGWHAWENLDGAPPPGDPGIKGAPTACSSAPSHLSVFA